MERPSEPGIIKNNKITGLLLKNRKSVSPFLYVVPHIRHWIKILWVFLVYPVHHLPNRFFGCFISLFQPWGSPSEIPADSPILYLSKSVCLYFSSTLLSLQEFDAQLSKASISSEYFYKQKQIPRQRGYQSRYKYCHRLHQFYCKYC